MAGCQPGKACFSRWGSCPKSLLSTPAPAPADDRGKTTEKPQMPGFVSVSLGQLLGDSGLGGRFWVSTSWQWLGRAPLRTSPPTMLALARRGVCRGAAFSTSPFSRVPAGGRRPLNLSHEAGSGGRKGFLEGHGEPGL